MRGTTIVRLAVYGCVLLIALLVWQVRAHQRPSAPAPKEGKLGTPLTGRAEVPGGSPITVFVRDGRVRSLQLTAHQPCGGTAYNQPLPLTFDGLGQSGGKERRFWGTHTVEYGTDDRGWQTSLVVQVQGTLQDDGKRAIGQTTITAVFKRNGVPGSSCAPIVWRWEAVRT